MFLRCDQVYLFICDKYSKGGKKIAKRRQLLYFNFLKEFRFPQILTHRRFFRRENF